MATLDGLDGIPWTRLTHAYGLASDVPAQIRGLASGNASEREAAFQELFANIWHQGTVYEATIFALPFLIELLRTEVVPEPDRDSLALLVACILNGRGYWEAHHTVTLLNPFTRQPTAKPADLQQRIAREEKIVADVRARGAEALELLLPYLKHSHVDIRIEVAESFAHYRAKAAVLVPALRSALEVENDSEVRSTLQSSLGILTNGADASD